MKKHITILILLLVVGCAPKQSPESKKEIALFMGQEVKSYIQILAPFDEKKVISEFSALREKWNDIEEKYTLPRKDIQTVNNALNFHELFLVYHDFMNFDMDSLSPEERESRYKIYGMKRARLRDSIDDEYWTKLSEIIQNPSHGEDEAIALRELRTNEAWGMFARPQGLAGVVYENFDELVMTLKGLTE